MTDLTIDNHDSYDFDSLHYIDHYYNLSTNNFTFPSEFDNNMRFKLSNTSDNVPPLQLPSEMTQLSQTAINWIIAYCFVFIIATLGNVLEFFAVLRRISKRCTPMNMLLMHLCVADLFVVVFVVALEIWWRISIQWFAGRVMCKLLQFCRAFGLYLSSFVLICLTLDLYYAVLHPLKVVDASKRVKCLLGLAWFMAALFASFQCFVFDVRRHPKYTTFTQCTTLGDAAEQANTVLSICFMYFVPLFVILFGYGNIIYKLTKESETSSSSSTHDQHGNLPLRRSDKSLMDRAKIRTLKLTATIVSVFIICWSPYIAISTWHVVDRDSAEKVPHFIQECLFIMVVANSCANPLVYGVFHSECWRGAGGGSRRNCIGRGTSDDNGKGYTMSTFHSSRKSTLRSTNNRAKGIIPSTPQQSTAITSTVVVQHVCLSESEYNKGGIVRLLSNPKKSSSTINVGTNSTVNSYACTPHEIKASSSTTSI